MAEISKQALKVDNNQSFPNNNNGAITPSILRAFNTNMIDSMVDEISYNVDSASWNQQIDALEQFSASVVVINTGSLLVTASAVSNVITFTKGDTSTFNVTVADTTDLSQLNQATASLQTFTASANIRLNNLESTTASLLVETQNLELFSASALVSISNLNASSASQQVSINSLNAATSSYVTETESGSFLITASFDNGNRNLTFTKGDNTTFAVNIPDVSGSTGNFVTTASFNSYTQSNDQRVSSLEVNSASVNTSISALNTFTASTDSSISQLNSNSASVNTSISNINTATASLFTSASLGLTTASAVGNTITFTKGDASTFNVSVASTPIDTGSFATTASFNAYTQSNDQRVSSLETNSASVNISITALNTFTASQSTASLVTSIDNLNQFSASALISISNLNSATASLQSATASLFTSASLGLTTASFSGNTLTFTKGDASTFGVVIPDVSGSAGTTIFEVVYTGENITKGDPLYISGSQGANPVVYKADASNPAKMPVTFVSNETIAVANTTNAIVLGLIEGIDLTGYVAGQSIYVAEGGGWSASLPSGSNSVTQLLGVVTKGGSGGKGLVLNPGPAQLPGLDTGKMWVGNGSNQPVEITTASFASSASFNDYTSSNDQKVNSLISATGSYATTGSNSFIGNQIITGNVTISGSATTDLTVVGQIYVSSSATGGTTQPRIIVSGSLGQTTITRNNINVTNGTNSAGLNPSAIFASTSATDDQFGFSINPVAGGISGWTIGPSIYITDPVDNYPAVFGFQNKANYTDGRVAVLTPLSASAGFTASLQNGYAWVGNSLGQNTQVATSSFGIAINTGSFATTGSNTFTGNQTITGSLNQTGNQSISGAIAVSGNVKAWGDGNDFEFGTYSDDFLGGAFNLSTDKSFAGFTMGANQEVFMEIFANGGNYDTFKVIVDSGSNGTKFQDLPSGGGYDTWMSVATSPNTSSLGEITLYRNTNINGNLDIQSTLTSSLQQGYIWVGNASGKTTTVATSSFATTGSNSFTGQQIITGSLIVTGSAYGNVIALSITSNTASMDLSLGNYFTLTLADTATTHISASNVQPGQSATLVITTGTNSSASLAPTMLQPSGSAYSATLGSAKKDVLSIVSVVTGVPFVVSTKNMV